MQISCFKGYRAAFPTHGLCGFYNDVKFILVLFSPVYVIALIFFFFNGWIILYISRCHTPKFIMVLTKHFGSLLLALLWRHYHETLALNKFAYFCLYFCYMNHLLRLRVTKIPQGSLPTVGITYMNWNVWLYSCLWFFIILTAIYYNPVHTMIIPL